MKIFIGFITIYTHYVACPLIVKYNDGVICVSTVLYSRIFIFLKGFCKTNLSFLYEGFVG